MCGQQAYLLYTMLNIQHSQLPCLIPCISLKPFPHLVDSICHLSLLTPTPHSPALLCFLHSLPSFATLFSFMLFWEVFFLFFSISYVIYIHLSFASLFSSLYPSIFPSEPLSRSPSVSSLQCKSNTCNALLPEFSHLNDICGLAISDSFRQEMRANHSPTLTPHQLLLFVFTTQICCP